MKEIFLPSDFDGLKLAINVYEIENAKGVVQIIHGMCEHKERYDHLCDFLNTLGYIAVISDNRGHGKSINEDNPMGHFGNEGMKALIADQLTITNYINQTYSLPVTIYAHSMGTIIARVYLQEHADLISRVILSGIPCYQSGASMGIAVANFLALFKGKKGHSKLMTNLVTGQFNKKIKKPISLNAWISYNEENVKNYDNDELCGIPFTIWGYKTLFNLVKQMHKKKAYLDLNPNLPILILVGEDDPCTGYEKGLLDSKSILDYNFNNVELKKFSNMRYEIINEINYLDVFKEIKFFLS